MNIEIIYGDHEPALLSQSLTGRASNRNIFTDYEFEPLIDERFAAIKQGFDRIRGREPQR
jgi:hypothetical protein